MTLAAVVYLTTFVAIVTGFVAAPSRTLRGPVWAVTFLAWVASGLALAIDTL